MAHNKKTRFERVFLWLIRSNSREKRDLKMTPEILLDIILIVILSLTAGIAIWGIRTTRALAKEKNTLDFVNAYNNSPQVAKAHQFIRENRDKSKADRINNFTKDGRDNFLYLMNMLEILAIGLDKEIYDEWIVQKVFGYELQKINLNAGDYIEIVRQEDKENKFIEGDELAFCEFKKLCKKIEQKRLNK